MTQAITGNLTTEQRQEMGVLIDDAQALEDATNTNSIIPLTSDASTVDLSVEAQAIAAGLAITPERLPQQSFGA